MAGNKVNIILSRLNSNRATLIVTAQLIYLIAMAAVTLNLRIFWSPDVLLIILVLPLLIQQKLRPQLKDWLPFVLLILTYDTLRGVADDLNHHVVYTGASPWSGVFSAASSPP